MGSPGMMATNTCRSCMPRNQTRLINPPESTQARKCSGSETNLSMGRPTNQAMAAVSRTKTAMEAAAIIFLAFSDNSGRS